MFLNKENEYSGIDVQEGLSGLRLRRSMYIGSTGILSEGHAPSALTQLSQEILSNSLDERVEGYGNKITITINKDGSMVISDQGRGIPKGPGQSFEDVINASTVPHASGKFGKNGYKKSGVAGMNGIGIKITNAVSKYLKIQAISRSSKMKNGAKVLTGGIEAYEIVFNGENVESQNLIKQWEPNEIDLVTGSNNLFVEKATGQLIQPGTTIEFLPDDGPVSEEQQLPVFESTVWTNNDLYTRFEGSAFLNAGLEIEFTDLRGEEPIVKTWKYDNGLVDYVKILAEGQNVLAGVKNPIEIKGSIVENKYEFDLTAALLFTDDISTNLVSFANGVPTKDGGPHLDGFLNALTKSVNDYAKKTKLLKSGNLAQQDVLEGLVGTFAVNIPSEIAEFDGQTKEKLSTVQAKSAVFNIVYEQLSNWMFDNPNVAKKIIEKVIESKTVRDSVVKARQEAKKARQSKSGPKLSVSSKLKGATGKDPTVKELFLTEGDSASNIRRDLKTQAIFPLRGKIINAHKNNLSKLLDNQEVSTIAAVIGAGIGPAFELDEMLYHKIIITCFTGDTKVKSLDGNSYTFEELVKNKVESLWVYSQDKHGNMVPALAKNIRKTGTTNELVKITLDNGEVVTCTPDHYIMTLDGNFKQAKDLSVNESLMPLHTKINEKGYEEYYDKNTASWIKTYRRVNEFLNDDERQAAYQRLDLEENKYFTQENNVQTHHIDENKLNNHPDNLTWLTNREHFTAHGKSGNQFRRYNKSDAKKARLKELHDSGHYKHTYFGKNKYNGTEEQKAAIRQAHKDGKYKNATFNAIGYNGSEKNRETARRVNKTEKHKIAGARGKILVSIKFLQLENLPFDEYHYDFYRNISAVKYENILRYFDSYEDAYEAAKDYKYKEYTKACDYSYKYDSNKKQRTQIAKVINKTLELKSGFNEINYNNLRGSRTIAYKNILKWFDSYEDALEYAKNINHKITNIEFIETENQDVYCLTVPEYHNFLLDSGIYVKNCDSDSDGAHISLLLIGLFYKYFRPIIEAGRLYVLQTPLYKIVNYDKNGQKHVQMFYSEQEMASYKGDMSKAEIQRYKGLGEMAEQEAYDSITNPEKRHLMQITIDDAEAVKKMITVLLSEDAKLRKEFVDEYVDFEKMYQEQFL